MQKAAGWELVPLQEAAELSSLKPQLDQLGVPLYAVVKEDVGTEIQNFKPYFKGEIFLDEKVSVRVLRASLWTQRKAFRTCGKSSLGLLWVDQRRVCVLHRGVFMGPVSGRWVFWASCELECGWTAWGPLETGSWATSLVKASSSEESLSLGVNSR